MDGVLALSDQLAAAVEQAGRALLAVHGRPRVASTGIHWRPGLIVTASHTVETDDDLTVAGPDGRRISATLVGREAAIDIAVLRAEVSGVAVARLGDSDAMRVGHMVLAVGAGPRASWGVISAVGDAWTRRSDDDVFSLDLTLYPGFSGGPLIDVRGLVVGITTSGASRHRQLAIPSKAADRLVDAAARHGRIPHAYLGVGTQPVRLPPGAGGAGAEETRRTAVIVVEIQPGSPAAAGLLVGDVILALDGVPVADPLDLRAALRPDRIGHRVRVSLIRAGRVEDVDLTIGERPGRTR
jgi:S1-C subfamily serine protease